VLALSGFGAKTTCRECKGGLKLKSLRNTGLAPGSQKKSINCSSIVAKLRS